MSKRLELDDSYLKNWTSPIQWLSETEITLAKSAFYPGGGGQVPDHGLFKLGDDSVPVTCEGIRDGQVLVQLNDTVSTHPDEAEFELNWDRRYHAMRLHTAYHCLVGLAWTLYGARVAGGGMSDGRGRIDFSPEIDRAGIERVVAEANRAISQGASVSIDYIPALEAQKFPELVKLLENRAPMTNSSHYRVIEIDGIDREINGGTHVRDLAEVGGIEAGKISSAGRGSKRFKFTVI